MHQMTVVELGVITQKLQLPTALSPVITQAIAAADWPKVTVLLLTAA
jgi:hypothetical protein